MSRLKKVKAPAPKVETLESAGIRRNGEVHGKGSRAHWQVRAALGDRDPYVKNMDDEEGFITSTGRFVTRAEAVDVGVAAGQLSKDWLKVGRSLLSSDVW